MDAKLKRKWVKALRSGKYKQGKGSLKYKGRMCCLGVLADIQRIDWSTMDASDRITLDLPGGLNAGLTRRQRNILGSMNDGSYCWATARDEQKQSFEQIADYIEKHIRAR